MPRETSFDRNTVLARARDLFWEQGYTATSIQDLEDALGIRRSSIYNTFGDKRKLYDLTLVQYQEENLGRLRSQLATTSDLRATLRQLFDQAVNTEHPECISSARGCYIVNATTEMANSCSEALRFVAENRQRFVALMADALTEAQTSGQLAAEADVRQLANFLYVCYNGLQVVVQSKIDRSELTEAMQLAVDGLPWTPSHQ